MKVLFTILSIKTDNNFFLDSTKLLINEILTLTKHDILLTTNDVDYFSDIKNPRLIVRNNITSDLTLKYMNSYEFNYNLKFLAFKDIPEEYDIIFYVDGDIKLEKWDDNSDLLLNQIIKTYDFIGTRLNCVLKNEVSQYEEIGICLFIHKILSYNILSMDRNDKIFESILPSEHYFILKNEPEKIRKFYEKWSELNTILQNLNGGNGSWGDGFEIGISSNYAGFESYLDQSYSVLELDFGMKFNGNKYKK